MPLITGYILDIPARRLFPGELNFDDGVIVSIRERTHQDVKQQYILPGFTDSHVHIESSMLVPSEFARLAVVHGTVSTVSDPHEIANVCGLNGVDFMIQNGCTVPFKFVFGAPSCVPATVFETAGASLNAKEVSTLLNRPEIKYLSEMMNFPGVLNGDPEVMQKIAAAHAAGKPVDGHAPGLRGDLARKYIAAGIETDHECFTAEEAIDKLSAGMKILIREGSAAKNFEALIGLLPDYPHLVMFCSDDKHPDSLVAGHINQLCARAVKKGMDVFDVLQAACVNPVVHYNSGVGLLQPGDAADFIVIKDLIDFKVMQTFIDGEMVAENGRSLISAPESAVLNNFHCDPVVAADMRYPQPESDEVAVIEALDGQLITNKLSVPMSSIINKVSGYCESNPSLDLLKIVVVNRYQPATPAIAFIKNIGLKKGAIASSVAHDSHNIVAVGVSDEEICSAVNLVIQAKGGVSCVNGETQKLLALPVAGLMSNADGYIVAEEYTAIDQMAKSLGSPLSAPFMTLSFMALLVIPHLKLSDKGLFDGDNFRFI
ncbi:MAG: adenine deaminase [Gemmatimonadaceae bacterium]|nr:adenine deaminase [Chitinophagaceae bacterium]